MVFFGAFCMLIIGVSPLLGFVPFHYQNISTVADRYLYFPIISVSLCFAFFVVSVKKSWLAGILVLIPIVLAIKTSSQLPVWENSFANSSHVLQTTPRSVIARNNLAVEYQRRGDYSSAVKHYKAALEIEPRNPLLINNTGSALLQLRRFYEAEDYFLRALEIMPGHPVFINNLEFARQRVVPRLHTEPSAHQNQK